MINFYYMDDFVTIAVFQYPHEAHVWKSKLESLEIEAFLKDEMTVQVYNFYSNAIGGVKLQVRERDVEVAQSILQQGGVVQASKEQYSGYFNWINERTKTWPLVGKWPVEIRTVFIIASAILLLIMFIFSAEIMEFIETSQKDREIKELEAESRGAETQLFQELDSIMTINPEQAILLAKSYLDTTYFNESALCWRLGYGYYQLDSFKVASEYFEAFLSLSDYRAEGLAAVAKCQLKLKDYDEAIRNYKYASNKNKVHLQDLAYVYEITGDLENADEYYTQYIQNRELKDKSAVFNPSFIKLKEKRDSIHLIVISNR
ncbi:DUF2007 domain-containing protein [Fulvivirga maritima]|uniref:putative signal transducing protein n=1 Tax=Fulvivirga maritima TaxID=2904247 RepID=UPI001F3694DC|nr:DUF2007 domain-containing protein [Fulvivirga maritima]UII29206.1 DUF2007 domain-containing protein [Fulvivirga maritima]